MERTSFSYLGTWSICTFFLCRKGHGHFHKWSRPVLRISSLPRRNSRPRSESNLCFYNQREETLSIEQLRLYRGQGRPKSVLPPVGSKINPRIDSRANCRCRNSGRRISSVGACLLDELLGPSSRMVKTGEIFL